MAASSSGGLNPFGPGSPFQRDAAVFADQVEPVWPARIGKFHFVVEIVHNRREPDTEIANTGIGVFHFLVERFRRLQKYAVAFVRVHLPAVNRVSFPDINQQKSNFPFVLRRQGVESADLRPKRRSGIAAEDQGDWQSLLEAR